jgi:putative ABC transport system ATP-binding protein
VTGRVIVQATDLVKVYHRGASEVRAVDGISLQIGAGEYVAVMGRSGSGKTTLLDLVGCLLRPTSGQLAIDGTSVIGASESSLATLRRERIGFVFQEFNLIATLNALENVMLPLRYGPRRPDGRQRAEELLDLVGLRDRVHHRPTELSGGEQQRVAIARALINEPALLLADEPTGELDSTTSAALLAMISELNTQRGLTVVVVTHDPGVAGSAQRVIRLSDGHVENDVLADDPRFGAVLHGESPGAAGHPGRRLIARFVPRVGRRK